MKRPGMLVGKFSTPRKWKLLCVEGRLGERRQTCLSPQPPVSVSQKGLVSLEEKVALEMHVLIGLINSFPGIH